MHLKITEALTLYMTQSNITLLELYIKIIILVYYINIELLS